MIDIKAKITGKLIYDITKLAKLLKPVTLQDELFAFTKDIFDKYQVTFPTNWDSISNEEREEFLSKLSVEDRQRMLSISTTKYNDADNLDSFNKVYCEILSYLLGNKITPETIYETYDMQEVTETVDSFLVRNNIIRKQN